MNGRVIGEPALESLRGAFTFSRRTGC